MDGKVRVINVQDMAFERRMHGQGFAFDRHELVPADGRSRCCVRVYSIPPGMANYPYHTHETHEEVFYIISGHGMVLTEEGERPLAPGDVMICPPTPGGAHKILNPNEEPLVYLEVDAVSFPEVAHYPLSGGVGMTFADRERNMFFIDGKRVTYADICDGG